jgi:hypothetical protein
MRFFALFVCVALTTTTLCAAPLDTIARTVKSAVEPLSAVEAHRLLLARYRSLRLVDEKGTWSIPELAPRAEFLMPRGVDGRALSTFVDEMVTASKHNTYVMNVLGEAEGRTFAKLQARIASEGSKVLPDVVAHAYATDRLTRVMIENHKINQACRVHWLALEKQTPRLQRMASFFGWLKTRSVNFGLDRMNDNLVKGDANPRTLGFTLPANILEAVAADLVLAAFGPRGAWRGHIANARAGLKLAWYGPHSGGPVGFAPGGDLVGIQPNAVKEWDDLYATWNMSFVSSLDDWPYFMAKLVIPSVNDYAAEPSTYIHRRALALQIQMYLLGFGKVDGTWPELDWSDPELTNLWGKLNLKAARDYAARVREEKAAPTRPRSATAPTR